MFQPLNLVFILLAYFSMAHGVERSKRDVALNERYQELWAELVEATNEQIIPKTVAKKIKKTQLYFIKNLQKPKGASRFSGFAIEEKNIILIAREEAPYLFSNPERINLLLIHEGWQVTGKGDYDYASTILLNMYLDIINNDSDLPENISQDVLLKSIQHIFDSNFWSLRLNGRYLGWTAVLIEKLVHISEKNPTLAVSSGTYVGSGGDASALEFLRLALYQSLEVYMDKVAQNSKSIAALSSPEEVFSFILNFLDDVSFKSIYCKSKLDKYILYFETKDTASENIKAKINIYSNGRYLPQKIALDVAKLFVSLQTEPITDISYNAKNALVYHNSFGKLRYFLEQKASCPGAIDHKNNIFILPTYIKAFIFKTLKLN